MELHRATRLLFASSALAVCAGLATTPLHAQAFGLNEIGSCAVSRAYAVVASPCKDASAIFWNPAAITSLSGWNIVGGVAAISVDGSFTRDTTFRKYDADVPTEWVPHLFVTHRAANSKLSVGIGAYVPYGLTNQWTDSFPGRFIAKKASLATFYVQPNVAWQFNDKWSIGGGPIYAHSNVELIQSIDLSQQLTPTGATFGQLGIATGTEFGRARLKGSANGWGAQFGIFGQPTPAWSVGLRFLTPIEMKYDDADATFTQVFTGLVTGGTLTAGTTTIPAGTPVDSIVAPQFRTTGALTPQKASTKITHPAQIQAGVAYSGFKNWLLEADYAFVGWKRFDFLPITFDGAASASSRVLIEDYNNSSAIRLGAEYTTAYNGLRIRGGFAGAASAAPAETVTPLLPEQDRTYWTGGFGLPFASRFIFDFGYAHIATGGARGRIVERTTTQNNTATAAQLNTGVFDLSANVFSFTLKASF